MKILKLVDTYVQYALSSQVNLHNLDPSKTLIPLSPRKGEHTLRTSDIINTIETQGNEIALVMFSGVQFLTGQVFDMESITQAAKAKECVVGFDLAHAIGNVPLKLHNWGVDFAVWCSYKYLNASPGGLAGIFVNNSLKSNDTSIKRLEGWWGSDPESRFEMSSTFTPSIGASSWMVSNTPVLTLTALYASLQIFDEAGGILKLREKSTKLSGYLIILLKLSKFYTSDLNNINYNQFSILTPENENERGCQVSLKFNKDFMIPIYNKLKSNGVIGDDRNPDVIRLSPVPLYNTFDEVYRCVDILNYILGHTL